MRLKPFTFIKEIRDRHGRDGYTIEMMANNILNGVGIEEAPIDIEKVARAIGFKIYYTPSFKKDTFSAFVSDYEKDIRNYGTGSLIVVKKDETIEYKRYWQTVCLCHYILFGQENQDLNKVYNYSDKNGEEFILARALLMPLKELSMYINSPMLRNIKGTELLKSVANSFLVPENVVQMRFIEAGLEL